MYTIDKLNVSIKHWRLRSRYGMSAQTVMESLGETGDGC